MRKVQLLTPILIAILISGCARPVATTSNAVYTGAVAIGHSPVINHVPAIPIVYYFINLGGAIKRQIDRPKFIAHPNTKPLTLPEPDTSHLK